MEKIIYGDIKEITLPTHVINSLHDRAELANVRKIEDVLYIIVTVPNKDNISKAVCLEISNESLKLYADKQLDLSEVEESTTFSEFIIYVLDQYELKCSEISQDLDGFESTMDNGVKKSDIQTFFALSKQLIYYQTAINAIKDVLAYIVDQKPKQLWTDENISDYTNIKIEINQLDQNIAMYQQVIESIMNVSDSLFSNKLNRTMKTLTSVTLVLSIPTFITSFYGMNINLPFQDHPYSLWIVFLISFVLTSLTVVWLYRKDFF